MVAMAAVAYTWVSSDGSLVLARLGAKSFVCPLVVIPNGMPSAPGVGAGLPMGDNTASFSSCLSYCDFAYLNTNSIFL